MIGQKSPTYNPLNEISVSPSLRVGVFDIKSPSLEVPRGFLVHMAYNEGSWMCNVKVCSLMGQKLSDLQPSEHS